MASLVNPKRIEQLRDGQPGNGSVVYWISREQRIYDNWALLYAQEIALERQLPLHVVFCLPNRLLGTTARRHEFMIDGLREIETELINLNIGFTVLSGKPESILPPFLKHVDCSVLVCDFNPLRIKLIWQHNISKSTNIPIFRVDSRNIVPYNIASQELEPDVFSFHRKLHNSLSEFLSDIPTVIRHPFGDLQHNTRHNNWDTMRAPLWIDSSVGSIHEVISGSAYAEHVLHTFINKQLHNYHTQYNNPNADMQSHLAPYLHFGQISAQRVALNIMATDAPQEAKAMFLNNIITRREFADNFCFYNPQYDSDDIFSERILEALNKHRSKNRRSIYSLRDFEHAETHDKLWNAAQIEMITTGHIHRYLRKYWAVKILEWAAAPDEALHSVIYLNNKYQLGGNDSNSFAAIATTIRGIHDHAQIKRLIPKTNSIRNVVSNAEKFDTQRYIDRFTL